MTLKIKGLQVRERGDKRCSNPKCRQDSEVGYLEGATPFNQNCDIQLCDVHDEEFTQEVRKFYVNQPNGLRVVPYVDEGEVDDAEQEGGE
jgi:hypothetical protein